MEITKRYHITEGHICNIDSGERILVTENLSDSPPLQLYEIWLLDEIRYFHGLPRNHDHGQIGTISCYDTFWRGEYIDSTGKKIDLGEFTNKEKARDVVIARYRLEDKL